MATTWLDLSAATKRLSELDGEVQKLQAERTLIEAVLKSTSGGDGQLEPKRRGRPPGRGPDRVKVSLVGLIVDALRSAPSRGMTVAEIIKHIARLHPGRASAPGASMLVSAAIVQARKAQNPKFKVVRQGGPGLPSTYWAV